VDEHEIDNVVRSIASGSPVNWDDVNASPADASLNDVLRELRVIAQIADAYGASADAPGAVAQPSDGAPARCWGSLKLLERIGQGAFGDVYRARDSRLDRDVALKLLPAAPGDERAAAIVQEARLLARLNHPNVAAVYGAEHLDGQIGIWMEFVRGTDLAELLRANGPREPREVSDIATQLCDALAAVHRAGVLHRDIKATNVRLTTEGRIVLLDFGSGHDANETAPRGLVGTPLYLAPEVLEGGPATERSDIYGVGVLLFHLLTGSYPVQGRTVADLRQAHLAGRITRLRDARPETPKHLAAIVERAIHKEPLQRFASAHEMREALQTARPVPGRLALAAAAVVLVATTASIIGFLTLGHRSLGPNSSQTAAAWLRSRQLNFFVNWLQMGEPSPDGRLLSYSDGITGNLTLMDLRTGTRRLVTQGGFSNDEYAASSVFSPDSRRIAYSWRARECQCLQVRLLDIATGSHQALLRDESADDLDVLAWSHDGRALLMTASNKLLSRRLELVSIADARRRLLKDVRPDGAAFSPDDRFIVYDVAASERQPRDIHVLELASLIDRALVSGPADEGSPIWVDDRVLFASNRGNRPGLWSVRVVDGHSVSEPAVLTDLVEPGFWPIGLTRSGTLFYGAVEGGSFVYTADIDRDATAVSTPSRLTMAADPELSPDWSPDGRALVWLSRPRVDGVRGVLHVHDLADAHTRPITTSFAPGQNPRWSPDGTTMLVRGVDAQGEGLRLIDARTGVLRGTYLRGHMYGDAEWAPDGTAAFYLDFDHNLVGRVDLSSGTERAIYRLPKGQVLGRGLALTPDGMTIAVNVVEKGVSSIIRIPALGGAPVALAALRPPDSLLVQEWTRDGRHLLFARSRQIPGAFVAQEWQLWSVPMQGGEPRYLGLSMPDLNSIRPSPDGRRLAFISSDSRNRIRMVENVLTALQRTP